MKRIRLSNKSLNKLRLYKKKCIDTKGRVFPEGFYYYINKSINLQKEPN